MRGLVVIAVFTTALMTACDPAGLRRVRLQLLQAPNNNSNSTIVVNQQDLQEALQLLDTIVVPLGFTVTEVPGTPPKFTAVAPVKLDPVMVTTVPPPFGPVLGEIPVTAGGPL